MQHRFGSLIKVTTDRKVIVQLRGGLGNQLFGLFAGLYLAEQSDCPLVLDGRLIKFGSNPARKLEVNGIDLTSIRTKIEVRKAFPLPKSRLGRKLTRPFQGRIVKYLKLNHPDEVITDNQGLDHGRNGTSVLLDGYFSTFSYFKKWFENNSSFKLEPVRQTRRYRQLERNVKSMTGLHIRLGDYLNHPDIYPIPSLRYYERALEITEKKQGYVVFCENLDEAKEYFPSIIKNAKIIVSGNHLSVTETLCLMTACKNLITANSTYSQWAGIFVKMQKGEVIYPSKFVLKSEINADVKDWVQLDIENGILIQVGTQS